MKFNEVPHEELSEEQTCCFCPSEPSEPSEPSDVFLCVSHLQEFLRAPHSLPYFSVFTILIGFFFIFTGRTSLTENSDDKDVQHFKNKAR